MKYLSDYRSVDREEWKRFIASHSCGNIFHSPEMIMVYEMTKNHEPVVSFAIENDIIHGVIAGVILKQHEGIAGFLTSRCIVTGGPLLRDEDNEVGSGLINEFTNTVKRRSVYIQFRNLYDVGSYSASLKKSGYRFEDHLDIIIDLTDPYEVLKTKIHSSRIKNASKALRKGVVIRELTTNEDINSGYELVKETYRRIKLPVPDKSLFDGITEKLIPVKQAFCFGLFLDGRIIGFRMVLAYRKALYDYYAGSSMEYTNKYPNDVLILEILKKGCSEDYEKFIFGGAGKPGRSYGVRDHKMKFGGELVNFGRFTRINNPFIYYPASILFSAYRFTRNLF